MQSAAGMSTMVVEDGNIERRIMGRMLHSLGASAVVEVVDGDEALSALRGGMSIDLIICDLNMPGMDGMEFIRHLGAMNLAAWVIVVSGHDRRMLASVATMAKEYGVSVLSVIEKPLTIDVLDQILSERSDTNRHAIAPLTFTADEILYGLQSQQFEPFFQPKVDLQTKRLVGAEALARWRHPEHGLVPPVAFIPSLESAGLIDEITFPMIKMACVACQMWRKLGWELTVSINLSLTSTMAPLLAEMILDVVRSTGLDPRYVTLEITETSAMTDIGAALENLLRLRMAGFGLSVDDYGTGFSSLQQLSRIPFTELKIDQSFVSGFPTVSFSRTIVETSVEMARRLGIVCVAEGVETRQEWDELEKIGCNVAQGYFIGKPMDKDAFGSFYTAKSLLNPLAENSPASALNIARLYRSERPGN